MMGQQRSYIDECWTYAAAPRSGQHGAAGQQPQSDTELRPCDPDPPQAGWGNVSPQATTDKGLLPRDTAEYHCDDPLIEPRSEYWAKRAAMLLADVPDDQRRADLRYLFEEREAIACLDGGLSADGAGRLAIGELQAAMRAAGER